MNPTRQIAVFVGSLRTASINRRLALAVEHLAPPGISFRHLTIGDLPLYDPDHDDAPPPAAKQLKEAIESADGLLFVTPEYNRSIPGVLKNALDTASRPYGKNSLAGKPAAIIGASPGAIGTALAQAHLRVVLAYLDVPTLAQPEAYIQFTDSFLTDTGEIANQASKRFLQGWLDTYLAWVERHVAPNDASPAA